MRVHCVVLAVFLILASGLPPHPLAARAPEQTLDFDVAGQARSFVREGIDGQSRFHPSLRARLEYQRSWADERNAVKLTPYYRYDAEDSARTQFDLREAFFSRVGDSFDVHVGVKQVFWGVTEFSHVVDIVNQTDLASNLDGEDKLGQPMVHLSTVRGFGVLDLYVLTGFRERTFPGVDGRPRYYIPIDPDLATFESGAGAGRIDAAVRWSQTFGPVDIGLAHFSGTSRDPLFDPVELPAGDVVLRPHYPVIEQSGIDLQASTGDWAWKLEAILRSGFGDRYYAFNAGFERTLVGVLGSRADLGIVVEYLYDDRQDEAFDNLFEHDIALGMRWQLNNIGDTQALIGFIWDHRRDESVVSIEASHRLGETWTLGLEGRAFAGARIDPGRPFDPGNKMGSIVDDDYVQLELTKYF